MSCGNPFIHMLKSARESLFDLPKHQHEYIDDIEMEYLHEEGGKILVAPFKFSTCLSV